MTLSIKTLLLVVALSGSVDANVRTNKRTSSAVREYLGAFSYCDQGQIEIVLNKFRVPKNCGPKCVSQMGFVLELQNTKNEAQSSGSADRGCSFREDDSGTLINLLGANAFQQPPERQCGGEGCGLAEGASAVVSPPSGFWSLMFLNCRGNSTPVDFELTVREYNVIGQSRNYFGCGDFMLPYISAIFAAIYLFLFFLWIHNMRNNAEYVHAIHYLMAVLVFMKMLTMLFGFIKALDFQHTGKHSGWDVPYFIFLMLKGVLLFVCILLIGTGWSFFKPFLAEKDKQVLAVILPLQVLANIAIIVIEETNEGTATWAYWRNVLKVFDIVCCCAILLPIVWSIRTLREGASTDGKVARNLARLKQFRTFYVLVVGYIYFTRIVVVLIEATLSYNTTYVSPLAFELGTLAFYFIAGYWFRPREENPYLMLEPEDFDDITLRQEVELQEDQAVMSARKNDDVEVVADIKKKRVALDRD